MLCLLQPDAKKKGHEKIEKIALYREQEIDRTHILFLLGEISELMLLHAA